MSEDVTLLYRPTDGCLYSPSILHQIRMAETEEQLTAIEASESYKRVSPGTYRKLVKAAAAKRAGWAKVHIKVYSDWSERG